MNSISVNESEASEVLEQYVIVLFFYFIFFCYIAVPAPCFLSKGGGVCRANLTHQTIFTEGGKTNTWH